MLSRGVRPQRLAPSGVGQRDRGHLHAGDDDAEEFSEGLSQRVLQTKMEAYAWLSSGCMEQVKRYVFGLTGLSLGDRGGRFDLPGFVMCETSKDPSFSTKAKVVNEAATR